MRKIVIVGILVAMAYASISLVTAGNGFGPGDGTCDGGGNGECEGICKQYEEGNGVCDRQYDGKLNKNQ